MRRASIAFLLVSAACSASTPGSQPEPGAVTERVKTTVSPRDPALSDLYQIDLTHEDMVKSIEFARTHDAVWDAVLGAHQVLEVPAIRLDAQAGQAVFVQTRSRMLGGQRVSKFIDCGSTNLGPRAETYDVTVKIAEVVQSLAAEHSKLNTVISAWATPAGMVTNRIECSSTGVLEKRIQELVSARLIK